MIGRNAATNTVTIGTPDRLLTDRCIAGEANWLTDPPREWRACTAMHRYNSPPVPVEARTLADDEQCSPSGRAGRFEVRFAEPQRAVAPGQAIVLYDGDAVLGGGWIKSA